MPSDVPTPGPLEASDARASSLDTPVRIWQVSLRWIAAVNVALFTLVATTRGTPTPYGRAQIVCCGVFVAVCAWRSFFPVVYAARFCLVDSWASNVMLTRAAAMAAELSMTTQITLLLHALGKAAGSPGVVLWSYALLPLNATAQLCCWYGISTRRSRGELLEESLWFGMVGVVFASFVRLASLVGFSRVIALGLIGSGAYLLFQGTSVIPIYVRRSRDEGVHSDHLDLGAGLRDMASRRVSSGRWEDWRPEVAWMTLYFSLWAWLSIAMTVVDPAAVSRAMG